MFLWRYILDVLNPPIPQTRQETTEKNEATEEKVPKMPQFPSAFTSKYIHGKKLGKGAFSEVYKATLKEDPRKKFAVKVIEKSKITSKNTDLNDSIKKEIEIMRSLSHKNIVGIQEYIEAPNEIFIIMDLAEGGELFDRIITKGNYTEVDAARIVQQVLQGCHYLHHVKGVVHRDIKPENILFKHKHDNSEVMLSDFGLSYAAEYATKDVMSTACGTPGYCAPEVLKHKEGGYTEKVDCWSVGVVTYILLCGYPPFNFNESDNILFKQILKGQYEFDSPAWDNISKSAKDFVSKLMKLEQGERMSAKEALKHEWITGSAGTVDLPIARKNLEKTKAQKAWNKLFNAYRAFPMSSDSSKKESDKS